MARTQAQKNRARRARQKARATAKAKANKPSPTVNKARAARQQVRQEKQAANQQRRDNRQQQRQQSQTGEARVRFKDQTFEQKTANATRTNGDISKYDASSAGRRSNREKYNNIDIQHLRKNEGYSQEEIGKHLHSLGENANLGRRATKLRDKYVASLTGATGSPTNAIDESVTSQSDNRPNNPSTQPPVVAQPPRVSTPPVQTPSNPTIGTGGVAVSPDNSQELEVQQDNDQTSSIVGDNNTVLQNQDNSIRQYGGDNRTFVYNSGNLGGSGGSGSGGIATGKTGNPAYDNLGWGDNAKYESDNVSQATIADYNNGKYEDDAVSKATMAGFYSVNDSPAAQAQRHDFWTTLNRDSQKRYAGQGLATSALFKNYDARDYTPQAMQQAIYDNMQDTYARADVQTGLALGDIWNSRYAPSWTMPEAPEKIESNVEEIAEDAKDDVENM